MRTFILAMAAVALSLPAVAADAPPKATQDFIDKAAVANQFEIDTSQLALKYGKGDDVKKFAQDMIDDHTKIGEEFKATLTAANIPPPGGRSRYEPQGQVREAARLHDGKWL